MSAVRTPEVPRLLPMTVMHLDAVVAIEASAYAFPWSRGNFVDSLAAGYLADVLVDSARQVLGYCVAMHVVDEVHLLNITVAPAAQHQGHARRMLDQLARRAATGGSRSVWLEVRESNTRARALYARYGFAEVGRRPAYYPALQGREDALLMSLALTPADTDDAPDGAREA